MGLRPVAVLSALEVPAGERLVLSTTATAGHRAGLPGNEVVVAREHIDNVGGGNPGSPWTSARRLVYFNVSVVAVRSGCVPLGLGHVASVVTRVSALPAIRCRNGLGLRVVPRRMSAAVLLVRCWG